MPVEDISIGMSIFIPTMSFPGFAGAGGALVCGMSMPGIELICAIEGVANSDAIRTRQTDLIVNTG
jgi:hypothetical protein